MSHTANLLVELFVEELPPKALRRLGEAFGAELLARLRAAGLAGEASQLTPFASPRRLAAHISQVAARAPDRPQSTKLMPVSVALDGQGQPTPALRRKLQSLGLDADAVLPRLRRAPDGKAEALFHDSVMPGATLADGLQRALDEAIARLPIPKVMSYQLADGWTDVKFVRPAHRLLALHGDAVVPVRALGLDAGRLTHGHRFEALEDPIMVPHADAWADALSTRGAVIPSFDARRAQIERQLAAAAAQVGGDCRPVLDEALLDEVTALVERPHVLACAFDPAFLGVPQECLILTMQANQKYFPLLDAQGRLTHRFLVVSNIQPADPSAVIAGNERVVRPRLADAKFFYDKDRQQPLASRVPQLARVVYHNRLGTQGERLQRVQAIARTLAGLLGAAGAAGGPDEAERLVAQADRAALLAKADLLTDMVGEFPELQGIMGGYYARHDGETDAVAQAIEDHYRPRFAGDALPRGMVGVVLALADKLETLVGLFGIGQLPTGDRDPFALRRHALGVIRLLVERELPLALDELIGVAARAFDGWREAGGQAGAFAFDPVPLQAFFSDRFAGLLREQGWRAQEVDAVLALAPQRLAEVPRRLQAVRDFLQMPESAALAAANKRVANILRKSDASPAPVDPARLLEPAERALHDALKNAASEADPLWAAGDFTGHLRALAALKTPVDAFFDTVMVNADDPVLRANRLGLLAALHAAMNRVADLSRLAS